MKSIRLSIISIISIACLVAAGLGFIAAKYSWPVNLIALIALLAIISMVIGFILTQLLIPLRNLIHDLSQRASHQLEAINYQQYPQELRVMLQELNLLFGRISNDYDRNKRFSADAAHELRTPLTALKTQAQLALQMNDAEERTKALENVLISVDRSIHVVQQLLTLSRLDHEAKLNDVMLVNLETVAAEIIALMYPQALDKRIEIELSNETNQHLIMGNDAALGILLRNLIDNAIRYTAPEGRVTVTIKPSKNNFILLQVQDNGPGIPAEYQDKVFDRFFRVLGTKQTGSGLGLAIVKQITDLHNAKIYLKNAEDPTGLIVTIVFRKPQQQIT